MQYLTPKEKEVVDLLADAWNAFNALPQGYRLYEMFQIDRQEFAQGIHKCQNIIASRAVYGLPQENRQ